NCVLDTCYNIPCPGCDKACNNGACVDNPCKADTCPKDQVCKPSDDFTKFDCVPSCAAVDCPSGKTCVDGACVANCPACKKGQACDLSQSPPTCVADQCTKPCANGACCDPVTG